MEKYFLSDLKTEEVKMMVSQRKEFISFLLLVLISSIHVPLEINTPLFLILCPLIFLYKKEVYAKREFIFLFYFFCSYLLIFTLTSQNIPKSLVADFKIIRAFFFFPIAGLFFFLVKEIKTILPHSIIIFLFVVSNFLFIKKHIVPNKIYFSYYNHPNFAGFSIFFLIIIAVYLLILSKEKAEKILNSITILVGLGLIVISNSRSIWLGVILFSLSLIFLSKKISRRFKLLFFCILILFTTLLFCYKDSKKPLDSMSIRASVWATTYDDTMTNHPLVGFGFGTFKLFFTKLKDLAIKPHNSIVEIFQSSGILGLLMMSIVLFLLFFNIYKIYRREQEKQDLRIVILSCSALLGLFFVSLFDFRFFDFQFMASIMVFLGFLNAVTHGYSENYNSYAKFP